MSKITKPIATDETLKAVQTDLQGATEKLGVLAKDATLQNAVQALQNAAEKLSELAKDATLQNATKKLDELQAIARDETLQRVTKSLEDKDAILLRMAEALDAKDTTKERLSELEAEGNAQRQKIESTGEQVKATIPEDYTELSEKVGNTTNALKGTATGEAVGIHDTSPVEHVMNVKVRSKNIAGSPYYNNASDGSTTVIGSKIAFVGGKTYTMSFDTEDTRTEDNTNGTKLTFVPRTYTTDGTGLSTKYPLYANGSRQSVTFTMKEDRSNSNMTLIQRAYGETGSTGLCSNAMVEEGTEATGYTPYISDLTAVTLSKQDLSYVPSADGTVEGVTSLYPSTTLLTDTDGVIIDCEYNRDINKAFEELTNAIISLGGNV